MTTDSAASSTVPTRNTVTASDGVTLAVHAYTEIDPQRPTVLAIHGYPDNHHLWDGVAEHLTGRYNLVAYDVRGAGESARPAGRSNYRFSQLISDTGAVIDSLGVGPVHLLAHDWGSIQAWAAVTDETVMSQSVLVHVDIRAASQLRGQVLTVGPHSTRPLRRDPAVLRVGIHLVLPDPRPAGADDPLRGGRESY